ncbi:putative LRR receptor-like serine/threonine-protein kinase [Dendrobium catenatum]|uniref:Putative LRR receptor-like serine/threonine-protein kinase n=1 Tax=Dendrobium catenatum TaxID=906689 RepID=A0A2I0XB43_9ASPA|nr:putative LRR receptor-like serine/threonine-protein kinase [Dendrobium catenatum]
MSKEIANLMGLTGLYLNVNDLTSSIPSEIGNMANLQVLQLCYNRPEPKGPNASAGLLPREIPQSADLCQYCKGLRCSSNSKSSAIAVIIVVD